MFNIVKNDFNKGFQMTFSNKMTVSVMFGKMSHSGDDTAEVAVFNDNDIWFILDQDDNLVPVKDGTDVMTWVSANKVADIISKVANF